MLLLLHLKAGHILVKIKEMHKIKPLTIMILAGIWIVCSCASPNGKQKSDPDMATVQNDYTVVSYYFPNYHVDARNVRLYGNDWTEWELVKNARPRFEGHRQPKIPAWGYTDESNPADMQQKIEAAADHGIDVFVFDWYYYDDGPFLEGAIEEGFFGATNNRRMKFGLMWANHDWVELFPIDAETRKSEKGPELYYPGAIRPSTWETMTDYIIDTYFSHPSYWKIDGAPYFSVYDLTKFMESFGSVEATAEGVESFRRKVRKAGFADLHLNAVVWGNIQLPSGERVEENELGALLEQIGFSSTSSYVWIHHVKPAFPTQLYNDMEKKYFDYAEQFSHKMQLPYFPNVTMGWDSSPRADQKSEFKELGYPFIGVVVDNTPNNFKGALLDMKEYLARSPGAHNTFMINCWNEWTEGSYLEPDVVTGMAYLDAVKEVFGSEESASTKQ